MSELRYEVPGTVEAAVELLASCGGVAKVLAGGTDLLIQMRSDLVEPELVGNVKKIDELKAISDEDGAFRFGAAVSGMELVEHEAFATAWPGVIDGVKLIGSIQIKGRASVGGNVCNGSPAADATPALIAAGAIASIAGPKGRREVAVEDIVIGPSQTSIADDEIVVSFSLPKRPKNSGDSYLRFTPRTEMDIAVVGASVNLTLDGDGTCMAARVSLGAVAPRPLLVTEAGNVLIGTNLNDTVMAKLSTVASAACQPIDDKRGTVEYRTKVAGVLARRAAAIALERARQN